MLHEKNPTNMDVLVADDRASMRKIVKLVVQNLGFNSVVEAVDGRDAYQVLVDRNKKFVNGRFGTIDFIIADWSMPNLTGLELLELVRGDDALRQIPFMMLTAENTHESIMQAIQAGVTDYMVKPFSASVLEAKIRGIIAGL